MPAYYKLHMGHGIPCPRFSRFIWGTKFRARVIQGVNGARNSMPALYIMHMGHGNACPRFAWYIWGTEFRAHDFIWSIWARKSLPVTQIRRWGHRNPCPSRLVYVSGHGHPVPGALTVCARGASNAGLSLVGTVCIVQNFTHPVVFTINNVYSVQQILFSNYSRRVI